MIIVINNSFSGLTMVEGHCESEESVHLDCESLVLAILVDLELRVLVLILS